MFVGVNFREDGKKWEKVRKENFLKSVWLGGRERKMIVGPGCFLSRPTKQLSPQNWEKIGWGNLMGKWQKCPCALTQGLRPVCCLFFFSWTLPLPSSSIFVFVFVFSFDFLGPWAWQCFVLFLFFFFFLCV